MAKILVIEDEEDIREEVMIWLQFEDHEVWGAENGREGLEKVYQEQPDLVLCDISMPEMDGFAVLIELRSDTNFTQLPFIFLTAAFDRDSIRKGMNLGADDYITKPFRRDDIIDAVNTRLDKQAHFNDRINQLSELINIERDQRLLKSRLIGMFSHDFRNPLSTILSSSNILQNYSDRLTPERKEKHFQRIDGSVHLLLQMLDEMLMVAEIENGQLQCNPQLTDLKKSAEKIVDDFRIIDGGNHQITTSIDAMEPVAIDTQLVQHIITNLVSNALKYSPDDSEVYLRISTKDNQMVVAVQDAGIGIPASDLGKIFEPFFRADNVVGVKGTGLGLSLVKQLVDACDGTIEVTSNLNQGSVFTVTVPV